MELLQTPAVSVEVMAHPVADETFGLVGNIGQHYKTISGIKFDTESSSRKENLKLSSGSTSSMGSLSASSRDEMPVGYFGVKQGDIDRSTISRISNMINSHNSRGFSRKHPLIEPHKQRLEATKNKILAQEQSSAPDVKSVSDNAHLQLENSDKNVIVPSLDKSNEIHQKNLLFPENGSAKLSRLRPRSIFSNRVTGIKTRFPSYSSNMILATPGNSNNSDHNSVSKSTIKYVDSEINSLSNSNEKTLIRHDPFRRSSQLNGNNQQTVSFSPSSGHLPEPIPEQLFSLVDVARAVTLAEIAAQSGSVSSTLSQIGRFLLRLQLPLNWLPLFPDVMLGMRQRYDSLLSLIANTDWLEVLRLPPSELAVQTSRQQIRRRSPRSTRHLHSLMLPAAVRRFRIGRRKKNVNNNLNQQTTIRSRPVQTHPENASSCQSPQIDSGIVLNATSLIRSLLTASRAAYRLARASHRTMGSFYNWYSAVCAASSSVQRRLQRSGSLTNLQMCAAWLIAPEDNTISQLSSWLHCGCALVSNEPVSPEAIEFAGNDDQLSVHTYTDVV